MLIEYPLVHKCHLLTDRRNTISESQWIYSCKKIKNKRGCFFSRSSTDVTVGSKQLSIYKTHYQKYVEKLKLWSTLKTLTSIYWYGCFCRETYCFVFLVYHYVNDFVTGKFRVNSSLILKVIWKLTAMSARDTNKGAKFTGH